MEKLKVTLPNGDTYEVEPVKSWDPREPGELVLESAIRAILNGKISRQGQKATAQELGISPQFLNDIVRRHRALSERVANALGFMRVNAFIALPSNTQSTGRENAAGD